MIILKILFMVLIVILVLFLLSLVIYFFNLDMKFAASLIPLMTKYYDHAKVKRDQKKVKKKTQKQ